MTPEILKEVQKLLSINGMEMLRIMGDYGEAHGFAPGDWLAALDKMQLQRFPKLDRFESYIMEAQRKRQGEMKVKSTVSHMDPAIFRTLFLWKGQQVYETTENTMSTWTLAKPDGSMELYLSDRAPTHAEQVQDCILTGPRQGCKLLGSDAVYRAGVYTDRDGEEVFDPLPTDWRNRAETTTIPRKLPTGLTQGFTRLANVKGMK